MSTFPTYLELLAALKVAQQYMPTIAEVTTDQYCENTDSVRKEVTLVSDVIATASQYVPEPSIEKKDTWKQDAPIFQMSAVLLAISGNVSNARDGINPDVALARAEEFCEELGDLQEFIRRDPYNW